MKIFFKLIQAIFIDTLKVDGKWSRTSLTMFTAWVAALHMAYYDLYKNGFNTEVFIILVGVALGSKVTDAISRKIKPQTPPTKETTKTQPDELP